MILLARVAGLARANSLVLSISRIVQSAMSAAAGAFGVASFATPCYVMAASNATGARPSTSSTTVKTSTASDDAPVRPFRVNIPEAALDDLRQRLLATRWPEREMVTDRSQGVQLATLQKLARYWTSEYDWRKCEARLNALPQFTTEIDGVEIHFIHVRSRHENALPLIITHGWPGSVIELLETVGPLTDPTAHGGSPEDAFHLVLPSLPMPRIRVSLFIVPPSRRVVCPFRRYTWRPPLRAVSSSRLRCQLTTRSSSCERRLASIAAAFACRSGNSWRGHAGLSTHFFRQEQGHECSRSTIEQ